MRTADMEEELAYRRLDRWGNAPLTRGPDPDRVARHLATGEQESKMDHEQFDEHEPRGEDALFNTQEAEIAGLVAGHLGVETHKVTRDARFIEDLGADSLDMVEFVMELEENFDAQITDEEAEKLTTVDDLFKLIAAKTA